MKKNLLIVLTIILMISTIGLIACDQPSALPQKCVVTFDANGGSQVDAVEVVYGQKVSKPEDPQKEGYVFEGWFVGDEEWSFIGYVVTSDMTLKAKWSEDSVVRHTVSFDTDGGSAINSVKVEHGEKATKPSTPDKPGYIFDNWYYEGEVWSFVGFSITEDITLKAKWTIEVYQIEYELLGGVIESQNPTEYTIEDDDLLIEYTPTRLGYEFNCWKINGEEVVSIKSGSFGDKTVVASWSPIKYSITYHVESNVLNEGNPSNYTIESDQINLISPKLKGYKFLGWDDGNNQVTEIKKGSIGDVELWPSWELIQYNITYNLSGGTNDSKNPSTYNILSQTITLNEPRRSAYKFKGWIVDDFDGYSGYITSIEQGSTGNVTLTADWEYTPSVLLNGYDLKEKVNGKYMEDYDTMALTGYLGRVTANKDMQYVSQGTNSAKIMVTPKTEWQKEPGIFQNCNLKKKQLNYTDFTDVKNITYDIFNVQDTERTMNVQLVFELRAAQGAPGQHSGFDEVSESIGFITSEKISVQLKPGWNNVKVNIENIDIPIVDEIPYVKGLLFTFERAETENEYYYMDNLMLLSI